jgi:transposase
MRQKSGPVKEPAEQVVKEIRRATRRQFSAEEKIRIVLSGLRGEDSIAELCRREGIVQNLYYRRSKEFLEAGKKRLAGDTARGKYLGAWGSGEVTDPHGLKIVDDIAYTTDRPVFSDIWLLCYLAIFSRPITSEIPLSRSR